jgi:hypothetical protein
VTFYRKGCSGKGETGRVYKKCNVTEVKEKEVSKNKEELSGVS